MSDTTPLNYQEIMSLLKESNKQFDSEIYIPSLNKEIHTKPMNAVHLKSIITTALSGTFIDNSFNQTVYSIMKDVLDPSIQLYNITILDKISILLELRKRNVKSTMDVDMTSKDITKKISIEIDEVLAKIKKQKFNFSDTEVTDGSCSVTLNFPSIEQEFLFDRDLDQQHIKKLDEKDKSSMKDMPGIMFIYYLAQFIKNITIGENNINLISRPIKERLSIVENLTGNIINKIIEKIDSDFGQQMNNIMKVEQTIDGELFKGIIEINPMLFS